MDAPSLTPGAYVGIGTLVSAIVTGLIGLAFWFVRRSVGQADKLNEKQEEDIKTTDQRLDELTVSFTRIDEKLSSIESISVSVDELTLKLNRLEDKFVDRDAKIDRLLDGMGEIKSRVDVLTERIAQQQASLMASKERIDGMSNNHGMKLDSLKDSVTRLDERVKYIERAIDKEAK